MARIRSLRPNVTREEATEQFSSGLTDILHTTVSGPLKSVRGFGILLLETLGDRIDQQERGYLGEMVVAAERMQELNDGLTAWVRARNETLDVMDVSLESIAAECIEAFRARAVEQGASMSMSPLPAVQADATAIRRVLHHLLDNALR